jgi:hypothetical protein
MHVLCLSPEPDFLRKVRTAFPERVVELECYSSTQEFLAAAAADGPWNVFLIDFDAAANEYPSPLELSRKLGPQAKVVVIASPKLGEHREQLESAGHVLLLKPVAIGEVGLALRKLFAQKSP